LWTKARKVIIEDVDVKEDKMKKIILLVVLGALIQGSVLFAQNTTFTESEFYYYNFPIEKIYLHNLGYMVVYRRSSNRASRTFIPFAWFSTIGGKGEIVGLPSGNEWPSFTVYYKNGTFSHVRLKLRQNKLHETWGIVPLNVNLDDQFRDIEEVKLEH
jgi:hypothetical protein